MKFNFNNKQDYNKVKDLELKKYDFIIVGSGPAAVTLYSQLLSSSINNLKILMIERGDLNEKKYKKINYKNLPIKLNSRVFSVGGSSNEWSNISSYLEKFEMESRWQKKTKNLWPLSFKELNNHYKKLNKKFGFNFKNLKKKKIKLPLEIRPFTASLNPINFKSLINFKKIDLIYNCEIDTVDEKKNLTLAYTRKKKITFKGKKLIITCGGIESVNLILNSIKDKKILNMRNKKSVGKYFMDHPKLDLGYLIYPKTELIKNFELKKIGNNYNFFGLSIDRKIQKRLNLLNSYVRFEKTSNKITRLFNIIHAPIFRKFISKRQKNLFKIRLFCEMRPSKKNKIVKVNNKLFVNYRLNNIDFLTIKFLTEKILEIFSYKPLKENKIISSQKIIYKRIEDASHHMGGLIFSHNKNITSVDKNLKIYGLRNIYVCGSAIFPTSGSVNPTMTISALARRLGMYLLKKNDN